MKRVLYLLMFTVLTTTVSFAQSVSYGDGTKLVIGDSASFETNLDYVAGTTYLQIDPKGRMTVGSANGNAQVWIASTAEGTGSLITSGDSEFIVQIDRYVNFNVGGVSYNVGNISSPVSSSTAESFLADGTKYGAKSHSESQRAGNKDPYTFITKDASLIPGEGYSVYHATPGKTVSFNGDINDGDIPVSITSTLYNGTDYYGWNLLGNPYPSAISVDSIVKYYTGSSDLVYTLYFYDWSTNVWLAYNQSLGDALPFEISVVPVGQGFFIKKVDGSADATFTFKDEFRVHDNNNYNFDITAPTSKNQNPEYPSYYFELVAKNTTSNNIDIAHYRWRDDATTGFDNEFDSYKFEVSGDQPNIFFLTDGKKTVIQQEPATKEVAVGFSAPWTSGMEVEVSLDNIQDFTKIILEDTNPNVDPADAFTELSIPGSSYSFTQTDDDSNRFVIHLLLEDLSDNDIKEESFKLYSSEKTIIFVSPKGLENAEMKIFDSLGRCVKTSVLRQGENKQEIKTELNTGIYIVKISSQAYNTSKTLLIK